MRELATELGLLSGQAPLPTRAWVALRRCVAMVRYRTTGLERLIRLLVCCLHPCLSESTYWIRRPGHPGRRTQLLARHRLMFSSAPPHPEAPVLNMQNPVYAGYLRAF